MSYAYLKKYFKNTLKNIWFYQISDLYLLYQLTIKPKTMKEKTKVNLTITLIIIICLLADQLINF